MPLFVPDKTKFFNVTNVPLNANTGVGPTLSEVYKNKLYLFKSGSTAAARDVIKLSGDNIENETIPNAPDGVNNFVPHCAVNFKGELVIGVARAIALYNLLRTDGATWKWEISPGVGGNPGPFDYAANNQTLIGAFFYTSGGTKLRVNRTTDFLVWNTLEVSLNAALASVSTFKNPSIGAINFLPSLNKFFICAVGNTVNADRISYVVLLKPDGTAVDSIKNFGSAVAANYCAGLYELNGKIYGVFTNSGVTGAAYNLSVWEMSKNLEKVKDISGQLIVAPNTVIKKMFSANGIVYAIDSNLRIYAIKRGLLELIGNGFTDTTYDGPALVGSAYNKKAYTGFGGRLIQSTL